MKKILTSLIILTAAVAGARQPSPAQSGTPGSWTVGLGAGAVAPMRGTHGFMSGTRPTLSLSLDKSVTPAFGVGAECASAFNLQAPQHLRTSSRSGQATYLGAYARLNLMRLMRPGCNSRLAFGLNAGTGWVHDYRTGAVFGNYAAFKGGLWASYRLSPSLALSLSPGFSVGTRNAFDPLRSASPAAFQLQAGLHYSFGAPMPCPGLYGEAEINALNGQINTLRADLADSRTSAAEATQRADRLAAELRAEQARKPEVVKEVVVNNKLNTELNVFFHRGSSTITTDQMPNVERIARFLQNQPGSRVVIKGYASRDGKADTNQKLATARAMAVRHALMHKYGVAAARINAAGAGVGELFDDDSWNRVSVCTLHTD